MFNFFLKILKSDDSHPYQKFIEKGIVINAPRPHHAGVVEYQGRHLRAICQLPITLSQGDIVKIIDDRNGFYIIQPLENQYL